MVLHKRELPLIPVCPVHCCSVCRLRLIGTLVDGAAQAGNGTGLPLRPVSAGISRGRPAGPPGTLTQAS